MYSKNEGKSIDIYIENTKKQTLIKKTTTIYDVCLSNCNLISSLLDLFTHTHTHTYTLQFWVLYNLIYVYTLCVLIYNVRFFVKVKWNI